MRIEKLDIEKLENFANMLKAIAHPMRIAIVDLLEKEQSLSVSEIYNKLNIEQSITSHHLGILKDKGILISKKKGKFAYYSLKHENFAKIIECIGNCPI